MGKQKKLSWSAHADQFCRELGKKENGRPHKFYLGSDSTKANANVIRLEALWERIEEIWAIYQRAFRTQDAKFPHWDEFTLKLGTAISKGEWKIVYEHPKIHPDSVAYAEWYGKANQNFPMIQILPSNTEFIDKHRNWALEVGKEELEKESERHKEEMDFLDEYYFERYGGKRNLANGSLHAALQAYKEWIEKTFVDIEGRTSQTGKKQGERVERLVRFSKDISLSDFGESEIESIIETWRTRPKKADGKPFAFTQCKHMIRLFKHFLRWLHKEKKFEWKKPDSLDIDRVKIVPDSEIKFKVETYSKEELQILWEYATLFERQLLLLALNCGFSISEIGNLKWEEIEQGYIKGLRPKTKVYGEFKLWDITKKALGDPKKTGLVFVTENGNSLVQITEGNNRSAKIPSAWYRLLRRVKKHHPNFKTLGFHHLRKTAGDNIRKIADGETMGVFLRHGKPVKSDNLAQVYSNPSFDRVFKAQDDFWSRLADIFKDLGEVVLPRKLSPQQVRQIKSLKKQGFKTKHLATQFEVCEDRIRKICRVKKA